MTFKVAIVGVGNIGNIHAGVYQKHPDCRIVAVCDIIQERADRAADSYRLPGLLLGAGHAGQRHPDRRGQHVRPPAPRTAAITTSRRWNCCAAGIPVLGEKPISNDIRQRREMVALAKEKNLRYGVNLNHRFTPAALARQGMGGKAAAWARSTSST